jgi:acetyl esterase/lipase
MIQVQSDTLAGLHGKPIFWDVHIPEGTGPHPVIVFAHGFKGFKDWGHFNAMARWWAERGFIFLKFNFSHGGIKAPGATELEDLEAFGNNNFSIELDDLKVVIDTVFERAADWQANPRVLTLIGHSRGGGLVMLKALEDERVHKVVSWAGVFDLGRYWMGSLLDNWLKDGVQYVTNSRTGQQLPLYIQFYHDYIQHRNRLDLPARIHNLQQPLLHIHGTEDEAVPLAWAEELKQVHPPTELIILAGENHVFGSKHPWEQEELAFGVQQVLQATWHFLKKE